MKEPYPGHFKFPSHAKIMAHEKKSGASDKSIARSNMIHERLKAEAKARALNKKK